MIRMGMAGAGLALAMLSGAAQAQDGPALDCIVDATSAELDASLGVALSSGEDDPAQEALFAQITPIAKSCIDRHGIGDAAMRDYIEYSLGRIMREWAIDGLARVGLSGAPIDRALDFGPSGANPTFADGLSEEQGVAVAQAYIDGGVDYYALDAESLRYIGTYAAGTSLYWSRRNALAW